MKRAVVESYIGAIALGYLLAQIILHFVGIFVAPITSWVNEISYQRFLKNAAAPHISFETAYPEVLRFVLSLVLWYLLLRWLYMMPTRAEKPEASPESQ